LEIEKNGAAWYSERMPSPLLNPGDSVKVQATQVLYFEEEGEYELRCFAENNLDENPQNDTIRFTIMVKLNSLVGDSKLIMAFPNPANKGELLLINAGNIEQVTLLDALGKEYPIELVGHKDSFRIKWSPNIIAGAYTLQLVNEVGIQQLRIIIE